MFVGDGIDASIFMMTYGMQLTMAGFSPNMLMGVNSFKCMFTSMGENTWNLLASFYWICYGLYLDTYLIPWLDYWYGHICTCQRDAHEIAIYLGAGERASDLMSSCSESSRNGKIN